MPYSVYVFLDDRNRPYYVGKTNSMQRRRKEHVEEILKGNKLPKYNKARKLMQEGVKFTMTEIRTTKTEKGAFDLERHYIKKYRSMGYQLMNCTYGGPAEKPMKINNPKKPRHVGIIVPKTTKKSTKSKKKVNKQKRR